MALIRSGCVPLLMNVKCLIDSLTKLAANLSTTTDQLHLTIRGDRLEVHKGKFESYGLLEGEYPIAVLREVTIQDCESTIGSLETIISHAEPIDGNG